MKIKPKDTIIKTIMESNFLVIPRFQRPYSWDNENIADFWNDVLTSSDEDYFIGSMVFYRDNELSSEAYVVDGQQRLMTITILFAVLRNVFLEIGEKDAAKGLQRIIERPDIDNKERYTLTSQDPYPYFQDQIQSFERSRIKPKIGEEEKNIKNCYDELYSRVQEDIETKGTKSKIKFLQLLRDRALSVKVITIDLDNEDDAYLIFETLNTRGKDLTISDLVKNHITRMLRPANPNNDMVREQWREIQQTIGHSISDISTNTFLVHHWVSKYEYLPERKTFKSIRQTIKSRQATKSYLDELYEEARLYRGIFEPQFLKLTKQEHAIERPLRAFSLFRLRQAAPFALALLSEYKRGVMSQNNVAHHLKKIEHFHFKFTAVTSQRGAGGVALMYSRAARELRKAKTQNEKQKVCQNLSNRFKDMQPPKAEFILGFKNILFSREFQSQRQLVRYILEGFHRHFRSTDPINYSAMTIEHLMSEDANAAEETKASIGNLLFVSEELNQKLKNKKFKDKKKIMKESGIKFDPVLTRATEWNSKAIEKREEYLAELAYTKIWSL